MVSLGLDPNNKKSAIIVPSQERVPDGEKLRKEQKRQSESKFDEHRIAGLKKIRKNKKTN